MSIRTGQTSAQAPQSVDANGSEPGWPRSPRELRLEDRADRAGVGGVVRVAAGLPVDRADVDARRAADAAQRRRGRPRSASARVRPPSSRTRWNALRPVARAHAGPERRVRVHPLAGRRARQQLEEHLEVAPRAGSTFSIPITVTSTSGSVVHMRPFPSDSTTHDGAGLGHGEVRARDRDPRAQEGVAQVQPCRLGQLGRIVGEVGRARAARGTGRGSRVRFLWIAGTSRCDGRSPASWTISSARSVSIATDARPPRARR